MSTRGCHGKVVTAGLVEPHSRLGLVEVELEPYTVDSSPGEGWGDGGPIRASFQVWEAYHSRSSAIPVTRVEGITSTVIVPSGGVVSGQGAWVDLTVGPQEEAVQQPSAAIVVRLGGSNHGSRALSLHRLTHALSLPREFQENQRAWLKGEGRELDVPLEELRALVPVLEGQRHWSFTRTEPRT